MQVAIELPDDLADEIRKTSGDVARRVLEGFAIDSYRSGKLTVTPEELECDYEASRMASTEHVRSHP